MARVTQSAGAPSGEQEPPVPPAPDTAPPPAAAPVAIILAQAAGQAGAGHIVRTTDPDRWPALRDGDGALVIATGDQIARAWPAAVHDDTTL